jgi:putative MATE family efflux protein
VTPMWVSIFTRVIHVVLCPFLVFGWWLFPALGVSGAAWTNVLSQGLGTAIGLWVLFSGRTRIRLTLSNFRIDLNMIWRIVRIAIPVSFMGMQRSLGQLVLMWFISPFGTIAVAAHSLCQRVEMFIMMPGMGLGQGGGVLAGQNLGADQPERAERSVWLAISVLECFVVFSSVALLLWAENIVIIFSPEPEVIEVSGIFLRIAAAGYFLFSIEPILSLSLSNVGDTIPPLLATVLSFWLLQIPLAHFLPQVANLGVYGIRWGMMIGMVIPAIALAVYFKLGRWKYKNV